MKRAKNNPTLRMSYQERLWGYEMDKKQLVSTGASLSGTEFAQKLKALQEKWRI